MRNPVALLLPFLLLSFISRLFLSAHSAVPPPPSNAIRPSPPAPVKVGVVLDLSSLVGSMSLTALKMAVSDFYDAHPNSSTRLDLHVRDSRDDVVAAASAAVDLLINDQVQAIIGPQKSAEAAFVADLGTKAKVPVLSFSASSASLSSSRSRYFIHTAPDDASQAGAIAAVVQAFGWRRVVLIYEDSDFGAALVPYLVDALDAANAVVPYRSTIPVEASDDRLSAELYRLKTMQTRVFVVHTTSDLAARLFANAAKAEMMGEGFVWIVTAGVASLLGSLDPSHVLDSMQGVLGVNAYIPRSRELHEFKRRWRREFMRDNPKAYDVPELGAFGPWAYDTVLAVATAADTLHPFDAGFNRPLSGKTELARIGTSRSGEKLLDSILKTEFDGMGGRFRLVGGERNVTAFQVVNVVGEKERVIGYWTPRHGLQRQFNESHMSSAAPYTATRDGMGVVIWPGDRSEVPRGWEPPTSGQKLRIAVPGAVKPGFRSFLHAERDPVTNETVASGFVIEVFQAAVAQLPYALPLEYVLWKSPDANIKGDYNDLVQMVYNGTYDAVVGDVTITANRSTWVDFTLPYTMSGVSMVVPVRDEQSKNAWIFLKPLTADLWLVSGLFFLFTGAVVWILEHRVNEEFRGPPANQLGTVFYFSFSTLVFAHRESMVSNLSRFVVVIWVFVVLILQSSYTASLTSMLTVQKLQPTVASFDQLKRSGEHVGYLKDSFVRQLLIKNMGFDESKLNPYTSPQEYQEALSSGDVAAIIDEIPYLRVFLKSYCENYTLAGQTYKTGGFGFVFPKGSPIVPDLSRAILNITEGDQMVEIEKRWFGDQATCPNQENAISSNSLDFKSFSGLFLITGVASLLSLVISFVSFIYNHRNQLNLRESGHSLSRRLISIAKLFDERDLSSHTFKKSQLKDSPTMATSHLDASPYAHSHSLESPTSISAHTYEGETP